MLALALRINHVHFEDLKFGSDAELENSREQRLHLIGGAVGDDFRGVERAECQAAHVGPEQRIEFQADQPITEMGVDVTVSRIGPMARS